MNLSRIDRQYAPIAVTATLPDGTAAALSGVDVALVTPRSTPGAGTAWTAAEENSGRWRVLLAGPDADPTAAIVVPATGADLWIRVIDTPEVIAVRVGRITVI